MRLDSLLFVVAGSGKALVDYFHCTVPLYARRTHGLIGRDIIENFIVIKFKRMELYCDHNYQLPSNLVEMAYQMDGILCELETRNLFPSGFEKWDKDFTDDIKIYIHTEFMGELCK